MTLDDELLKMAKDGGATSTEAPSGPLSPARSGSNNKRNYGQMKDEKLSKLVVQMADYAEVDPDAYADVMAEARSRGLA